jgi:type II secretory pathway pseudopilin PulG
MPLRQRGLTLLELAVTLLILVMLTAVTVRSTADLQDEARYRQTAERLEMIRAAILGDPDRAVNGQAVISGFVADMGRLPDNIRELFQDGACSNPAYLSPASCVANGATWNWLSTSSYAADSTHYSGLSAGWRGPYLQSTQNPADSDVFTDGWGLESTDDQYGWQIGFPAADAMTVTSLGRNGTADVGNCGDSYDYECTATLLAADWRISAVASLSASVDTGTVAGSRALCLRVFDRENGTVRKTDSSVVTIGEGSGRITVNFPVSPAVNLRAGSDAVGVYAAAGTSCTWTTYPRPFSLTTGGAAGERFPSCQFANGACTTKGGDWNTTESLCYFTSAACPGAGGTWNTTLSLCDFTPAQCATAGGSLTAHGPRPVAISPRAALPVIPW